MAHRCKNAGGFVDSNCNANCDCHETMKIEPFDPGDPMDAMADRFRTQVTEIALAAYKVTIYRDLNPQQQLECFIGGALAGIVGVCLSSVRSDGADAIMEYLIECLPHAREMAESIRNPNGSSIFNRHDAHVGKVQDP